MSRISDLIDEVKIYNLCHHCDFYEHTESGNGCRADDCNCKEEIEKQIVSQIKSDAIKDTELFREIFLEYLINQSVDREEAIMYRNICEMSWNKYMEQLKENNNGKSI